MMVSRERVGGPKIVGDGLQCHRSSGERPQPSDGAELTLERLSGNALVVLGLQSQNEKSG